MTILHVKGRHRAVQDAARRFELEHLQDPQARQLAMCAAGHANEMLSAIPDDDPELTRALNSLADARDAFIRAAIYTRKRDA